MAMTFPVASAITLPLSRTITTIIRTTTDITQLVQNLPVILFSIVVVVVSLESLSNTICHQWHSCRRRAQNRQACHHDQKDEHEQHEHEHEHDRQTGGESGGGNDDDDDRYYRHGRGQRRRQEHQRNGDPWVNQELMAVLAFLSRFSSSSEDDRPTMSVLDGETDDENDEGEDFIDDDDDADADDDCWLEIYEYYKNVITVDDNNNTPDDLSHRRRQRNRILRIHHSLQPDEHFVAWKTKHLNVEVVGTNDVECCCPICLIDFQDHDLVTTPLQKCCCTRQVFHRDCIAQWLMVGVTAADGDGAAADSRLGRRSGSGRGSRIYYRYSKSTCPCCRQKILLSDEEFAQSHQQWLKMKENKRQRQRRESVMTD